MSEPHKLALRSHKKFERSVLDILDSKYKNLMSHPQALVSINVSFLSTLTYRLVWIVKIRWLRQVPVISSAGICMYTMIITDTRYARNLNSNNIGKMCNLYYNANIVRLSLVQIDHSVLGEKVFHPFVLLE